MYKSLGLALLSLLMAGSLPANAQDKGGHKVSGEVLFQQHCASCHEGGGNKIAASHPVAGSKQLASLAIFKSYLSAPPGHMPYYKHIVDDPQLLQAIYQYCKKLPKPAHQEAFGGKLPAVAVK